ncbi:hypothetical protein Pan97_41080 [Bremerella volcania]|uniref:Arrestin-like N-terminal domain-containing protein n=1 Tax=Bremerella volcania TaxID=2527984 RepID=A0A518CCU7_9BACT|nr:hypothetical protein [Bremerella volcania]QDU77048.1 hypothetical protein Pan97_41080 [Bremerella volcania]
MNLEPKIEITLDRPNRTYLPDDELIASFEIKGTRPSEVQAIEASVLWYTEGTGEEDLATHDFRRLLPIDRNDADLTKRRKFQTRLPRSPLSYQGLIVKIRWAVRVRVFMHQGKEYMEEVPFNLGELAPAVPIATKRSSRKRADDAA